MKIVKTKSIGNVDDDRIIDSITQICGTFHGPAVAKFDGSRRDMINTCVKVKPIMAEIVKRGMPNPTPNCRICTQRFDATRKETP